MADASSQQTLVHFYRAVVGHSDVWRMRMDATTNWAAGTTAAMITFAFGVETPHFVLLIALAFDAIFLLMESRRYQMYHLWWRRFMTLNRVLITPALSARLAPPAEVVEEELALLAMDLGRTRPHLRLSAAVGYRLRRNYGYIFTIVVLAWLVKLGVHPERVEGAAELVERATIAGLPGGAVLGMVMAALTGLALLAATAPTEHLIDWVERPPTLRRWLGRVRRQPERGPSGAPDREREEP